MTPTQARLVAERKARLARMHQASLQHFDRCYDEAQEVLPKLSPMPEPAPQPAPKPPVNINDLPKPMRIPLHVVTIQGAVCERFGISRHDMLSHCRKPIYSKPRQLAIYLTRELTNLSFPQIGHRFGGKDHTSILHACRQVKMRVSTDPQLAALVDELRTELAA